VSNRATGDPAKKRGKLVRAIASNSSPIRCDVPSASPIALTSLPRSSQGHQSPYLTLSLYPHSITSHAHECPFHHRNRPRPHSRVAPREVEHRKKVLPETVLKYVSKRLAGPRLFRCAFAQWTQHPRRAQTRFPLPTAFCASRSILPGWPPHSNRGRRGALRPHRIGIFRGSLKNLATPENP